MSIKVHKKYYRFWLRSFLYADCQVINYISACFNLRDYVISAIMMNALNRYYICG